MCTDTRKILFLFINISAILPLPGATTPADAAVKHKKLQSTHPPLLLRLPSSLHPSGPFLRRTLPSLFAQINSGQTNKKKHFLLISFFFFCLRRMAGWWSNLGLSGINAPPTLSLPISRISCLHSCDALSAVSERWAFHSTSNYK